MLKQRKLLLILFVALVSSASLGFELVQTKVLSALYFNNVVYMTVTIALLGFGISGVLVSVLQNKIIQLERNAAYCAAGMALSILICIYSVSALPSTLLEIPTLYKMILSYFILVLPFLFAGGALSLIFMNKGKDIFGLYFADLCACGLAVLLFSSLLWPLGAPNFVWLCAFAALLAFLLLIPSKEISLFEALIFISILILSYLFIGQKIVNNQPEFYKSTAAFYSQNFDAKLEASAWTHTAKIDVFSSKTRDLSDGHLGHSNLMYIAQDNDAPTFIFNKNSINDLEKLAKDGRPAEIKVLTYFMNKQPKDVLVIGVGGGIDIVEARMYGAEHIDGAEVNPATINFVTQQFRNYAQWPLWKNINIHYSEGRHFVRNINKKYDAIMMSGVDTFSALNSGAYVLSENYLYTVEAIKDYLNLLKPNGIMTICRWFFVKPRETLRLANLFLYAAPLVGIGPADQRIMIINSGLWSATFIKREPFTPNEVAIIAKLVKLEGYNWIYVPKVLGTKQSEFEKLQFQHDRDRLSIARNAFQSLIMAPDLISRKAFEKTYPYKIDPVYDDNPFFFEYYKGKVKAIPRENWQGREDVNFSNLGLLRGPVVHYVLYILLMLTTGICAIAISIPLLLFEKQGIAIPRARNLFVFFCSLGMGFIFVEIGAMQWLNLYIGNPMYSFMVVLASLLFFAGLGSLLAGKLKLNTEKKIRIGMLSTAVILPLWMLLMKFIMPLTEHQPTFIRILIVFISLIPLSLCMGFPFASGLRHLAEHQSKFISWAWGINGLASVAASILAIILAMRFGFTLILLSSSIIYLIGYVAFLRYELGLLGSNKKKLTN